MGEGQVVAKIMWGVLGGIVAFFEPMMAFIYVCFVAVLIDSYSAYRLSVRVKKKYGKSKGKFQSNHAKRVFKTMIEIGSLILIAYLIDVTILKMDEKWVTRFISGAFCFLQMWSIMENCSSESDSKWMKPLQKIMVNKAERHFDVDLDDFKDDKKKRREK